MHCSSMDGASLHFFLVVINLIAFGSYHNFVPFSLRLLARLVEPCIISLSLSPPHCDQRGHHELAFLLSLS